MPALLKYSEKILSDSNLPPEDKDMIVMYHKFGYELDGVKKQIDSKMVHWRRPNLYSNG
jgi:hypothetical protein